MRGEDGCAPDPARVVWWERRFRAGMALVLVLAGVNLFYRLDREIVTEWDESLYAFSAAEMLHGGTWVATTVDGAVDYYNTKPPLNVWLIAAAFKLFGVHPFSLRVVSATAAWLTVLVLLLWARRAFGAQTALAAGVVLAGTHGFVYVHSARSGNTDALFTLLVTVSVVLLWSARERPWRLVWLGPVLAAAFLLRGMAVLMPMALAGAALLFGGIERRRSWRPLAAAAALFLLPVGAWAAARYSFDGWQFLARLVGYDFLARSSSPLEGHTGSWLYYPNNLQKDHYEWLIAAAVALLLWPVTKGRLRCLVGEVRGDRYRRALVLAWLGATVLIPTLMQTKVAWYLNPFYPLFALAVGRILAQGFS